MFKTQIDMPEATRTKVIKVLNGRVADAVDLQTQMKQAHWNVKGPHFIGLHELFDKVYHAVEEYVDQIAERSIQLGGSVNATARDVAKNSKLREYPHDIADGVKHVEAVTTALATFGKEVRDSIDDTLKLGDADTSDLFTDISRDVDKWRWFVEAHIQAKG
jgi:starvation-inducible DNA-binding protein